MIIKKYVVHDMKEALIRAKYELGKEAIIVSQKPVRPGRWYQLFRKKMLEVTVAVEEKVHEKNRKEKEEFQKILFSKEPQMKSEDSSDMIQMAKETLKSTLERSIRNELQKAQEMEMMEEELHRKVFSESPLAKEKFDAYKLKHGLEEKLTKENLLQFVQEVYLENPFLKEKPFGRLNVLVGPTGVGKTTTIAKIASTALLEENKTVGLLTIDTYRIAAVEQLKKYAEILGIPFVTVEDPKDIGKKLEELSGVDIILVDTIGASPKDEERLEDIKGYLLELPEERNTYLSISMSQDTDTVKRILKTYKELRYDALILTKLDEVENFRNFWSIMENTVLPVQYFCHGQEVPEDLEEAELSRVLTYLWEELKS